MGGGLDLPLFNFFCCQLLFHASSCWSYNHQCHGSFWLWVRGGLIVALSYALDFHKSSLVPNSGNKLKTQELKFLFWYSELLFNKVDVVFYPLLLPYEILEKLVTSILSMIKNRKNCIFFEDNVIFWHKSANKQNTIIWKAFFFFFLVSALLRDCSLCWDRWNGTWRLHLTRPCL